MGINNKKVLDIVAKAKSDAGAKIIADQLGLNLEAIKNTVDMQAKEVASEIGVKTEKMEGNFSSFNLNSCNSQNILEKVYNYQFPKPSYIKEFWIEFNQWSVRQCQSFIIEYVKNVEDVIYAIGLDYFKITTTIENACKYGASGIIRENDKLISVCLYDMVKDSGGNIFSTKIIANSEIEDNNFDRNGFIPKLKTNNKIYENGKDIAILTWRSNLMGDFFYMFKDILIKLILQRGVVQKTNLSGKTFYKVGNPGKAIDEINSLYDCDKPIIRVDKELGINNDFVQLEQDPRVDSAIAGYKFFNEEYNARMGRNLVSMKSRNLASDADTMDQASGCIELDWVNRIKWFLFQLKTMFNIDFMIKKESELEESTKIDRANEAPEENINSDEVNALNPTREGLGERNNGGEL